VGSDSLLNADKQSESEDDDTDADCTVLYDVDESDAIEPRTAAADARVGVMRASAFLHRVAYRLYTIVIWMLKRKR